MTQTTEALPTAESVSPEQAVASWLTPFAAAVAAHDVDGLIALFAETSWWRDVVALSWDLRTLHGDDAMRTFLEKNLAGAELKNFELWDQAPAPEFVDTGNGTGFVSAILEFETKVGWGLAVVRLTQAESGEWLAYTLMTSLQELKGFELAVGPNRPRGERIPKRSWASQREETLEFADTDPDVFILGAGQGGLSAAAYLQLMGVSTLVVEQTPRVGDIWRNRYDSLVLHDSIWLDQMPFMPFPESWPVYTPKDKVADWFEIYATALDLNVWTSTQLTSAEYSEELGRWTVEVRRADGTVRTFKPRHFIMAVGLLTEPNIPEFAGVDDFGGILHHTSTHPSGKNWAGKKAVVVGTGNSGNDVAKDLSDHGAQVTLLQRSPTYFMTQKLGHPVLQGDAYLPGGPGLRAADLMSLGTPYQLALNSAPDMVRQIAELEREIHEGLTAAGFMLDDGMESGGVIGLGLRTGGGFVIDVGSSDYIIDGRIKMANGNIRRFTQDGIELEDDTLLEADLVVLATGFKDTTHTTRRILGDRVAGICGPVWGLDEECELAGMYRPVGQPRLWFTGGTFPYARVYNRFLAIQIAADLAGIA
ncbi:flavin-containing monooxygenase [Nocardia rhamnosiphila]